jgi:hypothetical protein
MAGRRFVDADEAQVEAERRVRQREGDDRDGDRNQDDVPVQRRLAEEEWPQRRLR